MVEDSTQPPHATRFVETTRGILSYSQLAPADDIARKNYIQALEAADKLDWKPLIEFWQKRLENV